MQTHSNFPLDARQWTKDRNTLSVPPLRGLLFLQYNFKEKFLRDFHTVLKTIHNY